ncbi:MAG: DUF3078 domain-containing protein [Chitinophagales bacterium]|nr:DUF3078 domain-containing protein [Chitinophagales bacterium]
MKKIALLLIVIPLLTSASFSQDPVAEDETWKTGGLLQINLNQLALVNWAAGGENSVAGILIGNYFANFSEGNHIWDNKIDLNYGTVWTKSNGNRKSDDRFEVTSKYGYKIAKGWYASSLLNFRTQIFDGYEFYPDGSKQIVSKALAPAFMAVGVGIEYKPNDIFKVYLSPATGKFTFVVKDSQIDETKYGLDEGESVRTEFGAYLNAALKKEIATNVELTSSLQLFNAYQANTDVDFQTAINMKINKYLTASLLFHLIYDHDTKITIKDDDGNAILIPDPDDPLALIQKTGPRTQFKEAFGVGFSYKF